MTFYVSGLLSVVVRAAARLLAKQLSYACTIKEEASSTPIYSCSLARKNLHDVNHSSLFCTLMKASYEPKNKKVQ